MKSFRRALRIAVAVVAVLAVAVDAGAQLRIKVITTVSDTPNGSCSDGTPCATNADCTDGSFCSNLATPQYFTGVMFGSRTISTGTCTDTEGTSDPTTCNTADQCAGGSSCDIGLAFLPAVAPGGYDVSVSDDTLGMDMKVGFVSLSATDNGVTLRCAPASKQGNVVVTLDAAHYNPSAVDDYVVGIRIVPTDASPVLHPDDCTAVPAPTTTTIPPTCPLAARETIDVDAPPTIVLSAPTAVAKCGQACQLILKGYKRDQNACKTKWQDILAQCKGAASPSPANNCGVTLPTTCPAPTTTSTSSTSTTETTTTTVFVPPPTTTTTLPTDCSSAALGDPCVRPGCACTRVCDTPACNTDACVDTSSRIQDVCQSSDDCLEGALDACIRDPQVAPAGACFPRCMATGAFSVSRAAGVRPAARSGCKKGTPCRQAIQKGYASCLRQSRTKWRGIRKTCRAAAKAKNPALCQDAIQNGYQNTPAARATPAGVRW